MIGKGTGISPFVEKPVVEIDSLLNLSKVGSPLHLTEEISLKKFERFALFKIGARLGCPDSKKELREPMPIFIRDRE
jgi:hypothetical protein